LVSETELNIPGETQLPGWGVTATITDREQMSAEGRNFTAYLDLNKVIGKTVVRSRQPGDRFQPLSMGQLKTLGEL